jgi:hypothetical protein
LRLWIILTAIMLLLPLGLSAAPKLVVAESGVFSVIMPTPPKEKVGTADSPNGPVEMLFFEAFNKKKTAGFTVGYSDYKTEGIDSEIMYRTVMDAEVKGVGGSLLAEKKFMMGKFPGREFRYLVGSVERIVRVVLVRQRLFQLIVSYKKARLPSDEIMAFFKSFKLKTQK